MQMMNDLEILNYALTLEHLETAMYRQAVGSGLLSGTQLAFAQEFGAHEAAHVEALTATIRQLGGTPVGPRASYNFPSFDSADAIMAFISQVEDVGVGAYLGQVGAIKNGQILGAAAGIYAVEALHTAAIRTLLGRDANPNGAFEKPLTREQVLAIVMPLLGPAMNVPATPMGLAAGAAPGGGAPVPAAAPVAGGLPADRFESRFEKGSIAR